MPLFLRRGSGKENAVNMKLRKAVRQRKLRHVAALLDDGASPTWMRTNGKQDDDDMNALLLACREGDVQILTMLLDSFFESPELLKHWGLYMYCIVIRNGNWHAFRCLHSRNVPMESEPNASLMPSPAFVAAEVGRAHILHYLLMFNATDLATYEFHGHSLLSIASRNGHYACVETLLSRIAVTNEMLDWAMACARQQRQAHVYVLLASCQPPPEKEEDAPVKSKSPNACLVVKRSVTFDSSSDEDRGESCHSPKNGNQGRRGRGSIAETEVMSEFADDERRSSTWLQEEHSLSSMEDPNLAADTEADDTDADYQEYLRRLDDEDQPLWTMMTPPMSTVVESVNEETTTETNPSPKAEEVITDTTTVATLAKVVGDNELASGVETEKQETVKNSTETTTKELKTTKTKKKKKKKMWYYHDEVILPYDDSDSSLTTTLSVLETLLAAPPSTTQMPPMSATQVAPKSTPQAPPTSAIQAAPKSTTHSLPPRPPPSQKAPLSYIPTPPPSSDGKREFVVPPTIEQVSRKIICIQSKHVRGYRTSHSISV